MSLCKILLVDPSLSLPSSIRGEDLSKTFSPRNALLFVSMVGDGCTFFFCSGGCHFGKWMEGPLERGWASTLCNFFSMCILL
jgi:hypothetical protein